MKKSKRIDDDVDTIEKKKYKYPEYICNVCEKPMNKYTYINNLGLCVHCLKEERELDEIELYFELED